MTSGLHLLRSIAVASVFFLGPVAVNAADTWIEVRSQHFTVNTNAGEREGRRIANQFEEIRMVFQMAFPSIRVDPGKPLIIIAVKNEDSMKALLPDFYASKDRMRPAGMFVSGFDRSFALLRTDVGGSGENPYHSLYHEYTHGIMRLNFVAMPLWLDEGLAEFYGNTVVESSEIGIGRASKLQLRLLHQSSFIPIQTLIGADYRSPLYNERDRVSVFYAESWALVHYLMTDPEARKNQVMVHFLKALQETNDSEEAARQAFGDLKKFGERLESYTRQPGFYYQSMKPQTKFSDKDYTVRQLSPAEVLTVQADFLQHTGHGKDAKNLLKEAIQQQPTLSAAHSDSGYYDFLQHDNEAAEKEFSQAIQLDPQDFRAYYYQAEILYRRSGYREDTTPQIVKDLEKVVQIRPNFAPAYAFLSVAYRQQKESKEKALAAAMQAVKLEPTRMAYVADVGDCLMALGRDKEAHYIGERLAKIARTPTEKAIAESFSKRLARHEDFVTKNRGKAAGDDASAENLSMGDDADDSVETAVLEKSSKPESQTSQQGGSEEGVIREVLCNASAGATIKFAILGDTLLLRVRDLSAVEYKVAGKEPTASANACAGWSGRKARITFKPAEDKKFRGEIVAIDFQ